MNRFSVVELLRGIYPHHQWLEWYFPTVPPNFWSSPANQKRFIEWAAGELDVKTLSDWYMVSTVELAKLRGATDRQNERVREYQSLPFSLLCTI
jgi:hypothetical protein